MDAIKCEAFIYSARLGSMTEAAEALNYTQSGITRMINSLENEIGFPLFIRSKKGVSLTENGKEMMPVLTEIVNAHRNAKQAASDIRGIIKGTVTVGSYFSISAMIMPTVISQFKSLFPGIKIRIQEGGNTEMAKWLNEGSVDCCFCAKPLDTVVCDWQPIFEDEMVVWLPKDHTMATKSSFPIKDLEQWPFIHTSPEQDTDQDRLISKFGLKMNEVYTTKDGFSTYNMVASGLGISFNQRLISTQWNKSIAEIPFEPRQYVSLGIAVPSMEMASPATKKFIDCIKMVTNSIKNGG